MNKSRAVARKRRHYSLRKKLAGTADRPRLAVFRSNKYIYCQIIDDLSGTTLAAASSNEKDLSAKRLNKETAGEVGTLIAGRAKEAGIATVVFDRGGYPYHGRVAALADAARDAGLEL